MRKKKEDLARGSEAAMEIIFVHPVMQIADPDRLVFTAGSLMLMLMLMLLRVRYMLVMQLLVLVVRHIWLWRRRRVMMRRQHVMLHYHSRRWILHRYPLAGQWQRRWRRLRLLLPLILLRLFGIIRAV